MTIECTVLSNKYVNYNIQRFINYFIKNNYI